MLPFGEEDFEFGKGADEEVEEGLGNGPLFVWVARGWEGADRVQDVAELVGLDLRDDVDQVKFFSLGKCETEVALGDATLLAPVLFGEDKVDELAPMVEMGGVGFGGLVAVGAEGDRRMCAEIPGFSAPALGKPR